MFAEYKVEGQIQHKPAAVNAAGKMLPAGYDDIESIQKVGMMVWNPLALAWERGAQSGSSSGTTAPTVTKRVDVASALLIYVGEAVPGSVETASVWVVRKNTFDASGNPTATYIASGAWSGRSTLNYQ